MKILLVVGILFVVGITGVLISMSFYTNDESKGEGISASESYDAKSFFRNGGRSWLSITPYYNTINATIGSTIQLPVTLTHVASKNPLTVVTVRYVGIQSGDVPSCTSAIPQIPSKAIGFDYNTHQSNEFSLIAGESKKIILNMTIPQEWPKCVDSPTFWHLDFVKVSDLDPKDFLMDNTGVLIRVVG